jgi:FtsP/CotA-like multicopper oxidase with cupredoxin domain
MRRTTRALLSLAALVAIATTPVTARAMIDGLSHPGDATPTFNFVAAEGYITLPDGMSIYAWGYGDADAGGFMQYPGPTLIVTEGDQVTINLTNNLPVPTSIVFPGHASVTPAAPAGKLAAEVAPGQTVAYVFTASRAGTFIYHSGTQPDLQLEMGLVGAIVVRPAGAPGTAYGQDATAFQRETLFLLTEIDPEIHIWTEFGAYDQVDTRRRWPTAWFINGRSAPDTMAPAGAPWLPYQPYDCMPRIHPGEKLLLRIVSAGRDPHPFHTHGMHMRVIGRDGALLESAPGVGPDLSYQDFTISVPPGGTAEALFTWSGEKIGWDIYGHTKTSDPMQPGEYAPDHGKKFPVTLPDKKELTIGENYSGSPFLGKKGSLPPGTGNGNEQGGYFYMWHSHNEREMTTNDLFPGGLMTMFVVEHPATPIP